jgi:hypothetical protein
MQLMRGKISTRARTDHLGHLAKTRALARSSTRYLGICDTWRLRCHLDQVEKRNYISANSHVQGFSLIPRSASKHLSITARSWQTIAQTFRITVISVLALALLGTCDDCQASILQEESSQIVAHQLDHSIGQARASLAQVDGVQNLVISDFAGLFGNQGMDAFDPVDPFTLYGTVMCVPWSLSSVSVCIGDSALWNRLLAYNLLLATFPVFVIGT